MSDVHELLRKKEEELQQVQREVEALRLVVRLMQQGKPAAVEIAKPPVISVPIPVEVPSRPVIKSSPSMMTESQPGYLASAENIPRQFP